MATTPTKPGTPGHPKHPAHPVKPVHPAAPHAQPKPSAPTKPPDPHPELKDTPQPTPQPSVMPDTAPAKHTMEAAQAAMDAVLGSPIQPTTHSTPSQTTPTVEYTPTATIVDTGKCYRLKATLPQLNLLIETDVAYNDTTLVAQATAIALRVNPRANVTEARRGRNTMTNEQLLEEKHVPGQSTPREANPKVAPEVEKRVSEGEKAKGSER